MVIVSKLKEFKGKREKEGGREREAYAQKGRERLMIERDLE